MKIELNFESMDEIEEYFVTAKKNQDAAKVLYEFMMFLRNETRHGDHEKWEHCYDKLFEVAGEENLNLWEV